MSAPEMIEPEEACAALKCTLPTLQAELRAGRLPGLKIGQEWVIPRQAFFEVVNQRAKAEATKLQPFVPVVPAQPAGLSSRRRRELAQC